MGHAWTLARISGDHSESCAVVVLQGDRWSSIEASGRLRLPVFTAADENWTAHHQPTRHSHQEAVFSTQQYFVFISLLRHVTKKCEVTKRHLLSLPNYKWVIRRIMRYAQFLAGSCLLFSSPVSPTGAPVGQYQWEACLSGYHAASAK